MFRTTALLEAPARAVGAALTETRTLRAVLGRLRCPEALVAPGDEVRVGFVRVRLTQASATRVRLEAVSGPSARVSIDLAQTAAGTLVTSTVDGRVRRRRALALADRIAEQAGRRALELADAGVVVATAIVRGREVLAQQRDFPAETAGRWELPGGRVEPGESEPDAVRRECEEELGVDVTPGALVGPDVVLADGKYVLRTYAAALASGEPQAREPYAREHRAVRWLSGGRLGEVDWLPADRVLLPELRRLL